MNARSALVVLVVLSTLGSAAALPDGPPPGVPGDDLPDAPAGDNDRYSVTQGGKCMAVTPIQGQTDVVDFYDYRNPYTEPSDWKYASFMPGEYTEGNRSTAFLYESPDGVVSLVLIHNARQDHRSDDSAPHTTVSFRFDGLPDSGRWVLMDDTYQGRDDRWSRNSIDWWFLGSRTDGAVFRGLAGDFETTIHPSWNENAALYNGTGALEPLTSWSFLGAQGEVELDMNAPVTVSAGGCGSPPEAALSVPEEVGVGESATLDASGTTDPDGDAAEYRWDFDGDGTVDETTARPTATHAYNGTGEREVRVTVVDEGGHEANATATVQVVPAGTAGTADGELSGWDAVSDPGRMAERLGTAGDRPELMGVALAFALLVGAFVAYRR